MTKTGDRDKNTDFWQILTKFAKFLLSDMKNGIFGGKIFWSLFIYHKKHLISNGKIWDLWQSF